jgi:hypothetical protein
MAWLMLGISLAALILLFGAYALADGVLGASMVIAAASAAPSR